MYGEKASMPTGSGHGVLSYPVCTSLSARVNNSKRLKHCCSFSDDGLECFQAAVPGRAPWLCLSTISGWSLLAVCQQRSSGFLGSTGCSWALPPWARGQVRILQIAPTALFKTFLLIIWVSYWSKWKVRRIKLSAHQAIELEPVLRLVFLAFAFCSRQVKTAAQMMLIRSPFLQKDSCRDYSIEVGFSPVETQYYFPVIKRTPADPMRMK